MTYPVAGLIDGTPRMLLDWKRVEMLRQELGDDVLPDVIAMFLEESDEAVAGLRDAENAGALEARLHFLKGAALNLGLVRLADLAELGEAQATGRVAGTPDRAAFRDCYDLSRKALVDAIRAAGILP